jgi:hypothetical protein
MNRSCMIRQLSDEIMGKCMQALVVLIVDC